MILSILLVTVCFLLILVVLMQNSKGGGISSQFAGANQIMGIRRGADVIEKATWTLAILLLAFSLLMTPKVGVVEEGSSESITRKKAGSAVMPQQGPVQQPAQQQQAPAQPQQAPPADQQQAPPAGDGHQHTPGDGHNH
jgi:preprotein translocase subunit SecG